MALTRLKSPDAAARWLREWVTGTLRSDSRLVQPGDAFIAWPGYAVDGRQFARAALAAGAATSLVEHEGVEAFSFEDARIASLPQLKAQTGVIADAHFGHPSAALDVVATTGTNGKTSTAWWTAQALTLLGRRCGVVGTLGIGEPDQLQPTGLTTPDPVRLHAALRGFVDEGFKACAIEASSIGIVEHRLAGLRIAVALFTNFTRDHLDYHGTMDAYWQAKRTLFGWPGLRAAVVNLDDAQGSALAEELQGHTLELWTYAVERPARLTAQAVDYQDGGLGFDVREQGGDVVRVQSRLIGDYNVSNLLAVIGGLRALGVTLADAARVMPHLTPVPGRMHRIGAGAPEVVVDYAHTPDALEKVLAALRPLAAARGGALWCVFGCGGDRDASKRPLMGGIAQRGADRVIVTSDNPRSEPPMAILKQIAAGMQDATIVEDRSAAIAQAVRDADAHDVILVAGKGHEDYQEIAGVKHPYSDVEQAQAALNAREAAR
jgi:UDP-N-acetylmuramyl-tripeptide synthetase